MLNFSTDKVETFINDKLKEDLKTYEAYLKRLTDETIEYTELKNLITTIKDDLPGNVLKTQINIGADFFMQAKVPNKEKILVDIGLGIYVEFTLDEAQKYVQMKINILEKQADVIRDEVCKVKAHIKLALLVIGDRTELIKFKVD